MRLLAGLLLLALLPLSGHAPRGQSDFHPKRHHEDGKTLIMILKGISIYEKQ
jgi:hypothetical protein